MATLVMGWRQEIPLGTPLVHIALGHYAYLTGQSSLANVHYEIALQVSAY